MAGMSAEDFAAFKKFREVKEAFERFEANEDKINLILEHEEDWETFLEFLQMQQGGTPRKSRKTASTPRKSQPAKRASRPATTVDESLPDDIEDQILENLVDDVKGKNIKELADALGIDEKMKLKPVLQKMEKSKQLKMIRPGTFRRFDLEVKRGRKPANEEEAPAKPKSGKPQLRAVSGGDEKQYDGRAKPKSLEEARERRAQRNLKPKIKAMLDNYIKAAMREPTRKGKKSKDFYNRAAKAVRGRGRGGDHRASPPRQAEG